MLAEQQYVISNVALTYLCTFALVGVLCVAVLIGQVLYQLLQAIKEYFQQR